MSESRGLLARLREALAGANTPLAEVARLVAAELGAEVCSVYVRRPGDVLELAATAGLNPTAVGRTRLQMGEGIVGLAAATGGVMNLADAQNHPAFVYRAETGEGPFASLLAVPVRRAGRLLGVLVVQTAEVRNFTRVEVEEVETVAMVLAEALAATVIADPSDEGVSAEAPRLFGATPLMGGIAIGPVYLLGHSALPVRMLTEDVPGELERLREAGALMRRELDALIAKRGGAQQAVAAEVMEAFRLVAADTGWMTRISDAIRGGLSAEAAVHRVAGQLRERMRQVSDPYLRERLADLDDMAGRLLTALSGRPRVPALLPGAILLARRLGPADLLEWHANGLAGVVVEEATAAGHAAILARALNIPMLGGLRGALDSADPGDQAVLDGDEGQLLLRPTADVRATYEQMLEARKLRRAGWNALRARPAVTLDGTRISLMLNLGLAIEFSQLDATGADGIGLLRTEIALLARGGEADVAEQASLYARVLDVAGARPVVFRTLDLGGDKLLPGSFPEEENPAMGWRSIRLGLDRPAVLRRQLRALLLAADGRPLKLMFPMVASAAEFCAARALLMREVARAKRKPERLSVGTMLEVPSLLFDLPALLAAADFVSVGSNDLMQFMFAADRSSPALSARYDILSPVVLSLLEDLVVACNAAGKGISLCGEAAGRPLEALALASVGFRVLSMAATALPEVKAALLGADLAELRAVLGAMRKQASGQATLRPVFETWARERMGLG
jgi:phosphotransferase system enzyme I (PtsP)